MTFKILSVEADHHERPGYPSLTVEVVFETAYVEKYGSLLEYRKAVIVKDPDAVEAHYRDLNKAMSDEGRSILDDFVEDPENPGYSVFQPREPSPYDLGLMHFGWVLGSRVLTRADSEDEADFREGPGRFRFTSLVADCLVTRAAIWQAAEMKDEMERGFCRYGDFPDQVGAFRSGDAEDDFSVLLATLHSLWD